MFEASTPPDLGPAPFLLLRKASIRLYYSTMTGAFIFNRHVRGIREMAFINNEIDIATGRMLTQSRLLWKGTGGAHPEKVKHSS